MNSVQGKPKKKYMIKLLPEKRALRPKGAVRVWVQHRDPQRKVNTPEWPWHSLQFVAGKQPTLELLKETIEEQLGEVCGEMVCVCVCVCVWVGWLDHLISPDVSSTVYGSFSPSPTLRPRPFAPPLVSLFSQRC